MTDRTGRILLVDDDPGLLRLLTLRLEAEGHAVEAVSAAREAVARVPVFQPDVVVSDLRMDEQDGLWLLEEIQRRWSGLPVLILTAHGTIPDAVRATQGGAFGFLTKPIDKRELQEKIGQALRVSAPAGEAQGDIVTRNPEMREVLARAARAAQGDANLLISGESGSGKELVARLVHERSPRAGAPFIAVNCGAISEGLIESELFGHERGAFTGATQSREGLFAAAEGGTLFLDEVGDMPPALQVKLLRVLEDRRVRPVGSTNSRSVDVRVVSATHRDLEAAIKEGSFREDLFYRLNVVSLAIPPLSERRDDIPLLVEHFLKRIAAADGGARRVFSPEAMEAMAAAEWPGNVRQLENVVHQAVTLAAGPVIGPRALDKALGERSSAVLPLAEARAEFIRSYLIQILQMTSGNVSQAARMAKRNRTDFYKLLSRHGVEPADFKSAGPRRTEQ